MSWFLLISILFLGTAQVLADPDPISRGPWSPKSFTITNPAMDSSDQRIFVTVPDLENQHVDVWDPEYWLTDRSFPLISYAHGLNNAAAEDYNTLFDALASWGFVTIAHHACKSGCSDDYTSLWWDPPGFGHYYKQQLLAIDFALDELPGSYGINLDVSGGVGIAGHSMGGQSALFASSYDNITATKVPITAAVFHHAFSHEFPAPQVPFLSFTGEQDFVAPPWMSRSIFNATRGARNTVRSKGHANKVSAGHLENQDWENAGWVGDWYNPLVPQFTAAWFKVHLERKTHEFGVDWEELIYGDGPSAMCSGGNGVMEECDMRDGRMADLVLIDWWESLSEEDKKLLIAGASGALLFVVLVVSLGCCCGRKAKRDGGARGGGGAGAMHRVQMV
mmetsp:Transcript_25148/g.52218  ORF Transcript_25148/g.52218 Transcript_25148/m.52218 type:complete len:392 (+) Transcript_25148:186-1361(+)|eukprot:CAMPEP_0197550214 /NCGR_PEP_ID=MMETSP1320-20131121/3877_1 /TAXON_ID=91990 /ORGANISM="Bolidomonas sp., Strain RCC2347" /LENGTH=391 /DNA_ID=CAMNT_0043110555 /DNA_START=172 /DNA_END=1347 /DNA_ORIENTATION=-